MPNSRSPERTPADVLQAGAAPAPGSRHWRYVEDRIAESGHFGTESLAACVDRYATERVGDLAYAAGSERLTWAGYARASRSLAAALTARFGRGERLGVLMDDGPDLHVVYLAAERAGLTVVGIGPRGGLREIAHLMAVTGAAGLVTAPVHREFDLVALLAQLRTARDVAHVVVDGDAVRVNDDLVTGDPTVLEARAGFDVGELFFVNSTSGTTGMPKCVTHTQDRWRYFHQLAVEAAELRADDVFLALVPAPFGFGMWTAHTTPTLLGSRTVLLRRFTTEAALDAIEREQVTVMACVSTQFIMMLNDPALDTHDLSSLRAMFTGGEAVPYERAAEFERRSGAAVLQFYGSNETGALSCTALTDTPDQRLRTAGRVIDGMAVRLFDENGADVTASGRGRSGCAGPATSLGYYGDPDANAELINEHGAMLTGDIVTIEDSGYLRVVGRTSDFIIRGGKNVSAPAVEEQVGTHPAVALAAAVAAPDPVYGERVCVYVELRPGTSLALEDLTAHLADRGVSKEMWPEHLVVVDELPAASGGKIAKGELRADIARRLKR